MSVKWIAEMWDSSLKGSELLVAIAIADHADANGVCFPGYNTIAAKVKLKPRQVQALIKRLEQQNVLQVDRNYGRGHMTVFRFQKVQDHTPLTVSEKVQTSASEKMRSDENIDALQRERKVQDPASPPIPPYKEEPFIEPLKNRSNGASDFAPPVNGRVAPELAGYTLRDYREVLTAAAPHLANDDRTPIDELWRLEAPPLEAIECLNEMRADGWRKTRVTWKSVLDFYPDWSFKRRLTLQETTNGNGQTGKHSQRDRDAIEDFEFAEDLRRRREERLRRGTDTGDHGRAPSVEFAEDEGPGGGDGRPVGQ